MFGKRIILGTGTAAALLALAISATGSAPRSPLPIHHEASRASMTTQTPDQRVALLLRSEALNRRYGLGQHALRHARVARELNGHTALALRSDALNRLYRLGAYASTATPRMAFTSPSRLGSETARMGGSLHNEAAPFNQPPGR